MDITPRSGWNARSPAKQSDVIKDTWAKKKEFIVHYSGASPDQTPRSIQNFHMDTREYNDIGYSFLVHATTGQIFEGRGWLVRGAHTLGHNTVGIGVCVIGLDKVDRKDVSERARASVKWLYEEACRRKGGKLTVLGHRDVGNTSCPGDELYTWLKGGMPLESGGGTPPPSGGDNWTENVVNNLPTVQLGHHDNKTVKTVQGIVNRDAVEGDAALLEDGVWGPKTDNAVRTWQVRNNVPNSVRSDGTGDGQFGRACWTFALTLV